MVLSIKKCAGRRCSHGHRFQFLKRLAVVTEVHQSADGLVRNVTVTYKNFRVGESVHKYSGARNTSVKISVQRLVLLVPIGDEI